jgi:hypothetical protein
MESALTATVFGLRARVAGAAGCVPGLAASSLAARALDLDPDCHKDL